MVPQASSIILTFLSTGKERGLKREHLLALKITSGSYMWHFYLHLTDRNLVTWPQLAAREAGTM